MAVCEWSDIFIHTHTLRHSIINCNEHRANLHIFIHHSCCRPVVIVVRIRLWPLNTIFREDNDVAETDNV